ncbi:MAG: hypothetical protein RLZZ248_31 [Bacteroidota bacterium]|jgi:hypothetical protein
MKYLFALFSMIVAWTLTGQNDDLISIKVDVVYLSSDLLEGRETGTEGEAMAAQYIANRFNQLGLNTSFQSFDFEVKAHPHATESTPKTGKNVIGYLDNGADYTVVIGAHYDHLGYGSSGSLHRGEPAIHNGADDNASGVAAMLRLAEWLSKEGAPNANNYLFLAFSGEEFGLFGSKYYASNATLPIDNVNYMVNMDMVGRLNEENVLVINGVGTSPSWTATLDDIQIDPISITTTESGFGPSDHSSFYLKDIPVLHFFTGQHSEYHKPSDDAELINYEGIDLVSQYIYQLVTALDGKEKLVFTKTKDQSQGTRASSFKVTLGVIPDYTYGKKGMRIDGVSEDKPAQKAGLQQGDVILKIGDKDIEDIYAYMEALGSFEPNQSTTIVIQRGEEQLTLPLTF